MRTLIVGTERTLDPLARALGAAVSGRVVIDPMATLGGQIDGEVVALAAQAGGARRVVVCLPESLRAISPEIETALGGIGCEVSIVPPIDEMVRGRVRREVVTPPAGGPTIDADDLIGRSPRKVDERVIAELIGGKRVMVTGAGGSIGRELVTLCARFGPSRLVLIERSENALFEVDRVLSAHHPNVERAAVLHDVVDEARTRRLVARERPDVVFHAAAHKHVPLMESHPADAVENNLIGTVSIAEACASAHVERFVLISSDKAVRPSSVMGATKRLAERYVQGLAGREGVTTACSIVRFGNVLGSAGSVLPVWSAQLAEGGPVTVTDERMTRYFMTIPEAAALVAQAGAQVSAGASVFVLDMGERVEIMGLAERFVRASGYVPVRRDASEPGDARALSTNEMEIVVTGIRPGEKLHEALAYDAESLERTQHEAIRRLVDPSPLGWAGASRMVAEAREVLTERDSRDVTGWLGGWLDGWIGDAVRTPVESVEPKPSVTAPTEAA